MHRQLRWRPSVEHILKIALLSSPFQVLCKWLGKHLTVRNSTAAGMQSRPIIQRRNSIMRRGHAEGLPRRSSFSVPTEAHMPQPPHARACVLTRRLRALGTTVPKYRK